MHNRRFARRVAIAALALTVGVTPFLPASDAQADEITDLRARADQISAQISDLRAQVEADTEAVEHALYEAQEIEAKIAEASSQLEAAKKNEETNRAALADYAISAYVNGGSSSVDLAALLDTDGDKLGPRQGYQSTAVGDRQELVDQLQAAQRITSERAATLEVERAKAAEVAETAKAKKASAEAAQAELEAVQSQVEGELANLIAERQAAEQRAREARARAAAQAAQERAEAREAAEEATPTVSAAPETANETPSPAAATQLPPAPSTATPPPPVPSNGGAGSAAVAAAASQLGTPYVWGGSSPGGFDCSGLTMWAWAQAGVSLPRVTYSQRNAGQVVPLSQLQPGDLVFYSGFGHVALYAGGGSVIHAPHTGDVVKYSSLYMSTPILAVRP